MKNNFLIAALAVSLFAASCEKYEPTSFAKEAPVTNQGTMLSDLENDVVFSDVQTEGPVVIFKFSPEEFGLGTMLSSMVGNGSGPYSVIHNVTLYAWDNKGGRSQAGFVQFYDWTGGSLSIHAETKVPGGYSSNGSILESTMNAKDNTVYVGIPYCEGWGSKSIQVYDSEGRTVQVNSFKEARTGDFPVSLSMGEQKCSDSSFNNPYGIEKWYRVYELTNLQNNGIYTIYVRTCK